MRLSIAFLVVCGACGGGGGGGDPDATAGDDTPDAAPGTPDAPLGATVTRTYRDGVDGYAGTRSVGISTYGGLGNPGDYNANGMTFGDGQNDWCTGVDIPSGTYSEVWLLRFENLGIPAGATVLSASLSIHGHGDGSAGEYFAGSYVVAPWFGDTPISCAGCSDSPVGWRYRDGASNPWGGLGASGGGDATGAFRLPESGDVGTGFTPIEVTAALDPAAVQAWVDGANHGVRIIAGTSGVHMGYVQAQRDTAGRPVDMRPQLTITYANP